MIKRFLFSAIVLAVTACTNLDERHVFNYKIIGTAGSVDNFYVVMGPGIEFDSDGAEDLPIDISHDVYGTDLQYILEVKNADPNADVTLQVFIDKELIEEKSEFVNINGVPTIRIEGVFSGNK